MKSFQLFRHTVMLKANLRLAEIEQNNLVYLTKKVAASGPNVEPRLLTRFKKSAERLELFNKLIEQEYLEVAYLA